MFLSVGSRVYDDKGNTYVLDKIIGQGGFGYVFKSHRENDSAVFAVKTTIPAFDNSDSYISFKNEIRSASKIIGENIIHYEYVHDGDLFPELPPYIIMEFADGGTLSKLLDAKKNSQELYDNETLRQIFIQLASGMKQVNSVLVHRDIKPDNILLCNGKLKISDFGLAKVAVESTRTLSFKGAGTPLYMAPEAWDMSKNAIQMDIYSMGIVFYEIATLHYPYDPMPLTYDDCKATHLLYSIVNPTKFNSGLSASIASLITRMLEKSIKRRFNTWDEIIELLNNQTPPVSSIDRLAAISVSALNAEDLARQKREAEKKQKALEKTNYVKLVYAQFEQTIINPVNELIEKINAQYAGADKLTFTEFNKKSYEHYRFSWSLRISSLSNIVFHFEIILKENFKHEVAVDRVFSPGQMRIENYTPQYKDSNILGWCSIANTAGQGFNLLLLDSGDLYGDWIIMKNKNNMSCLCGKKRREPFAFSLDELPREIDAVQITHLYSADFIPFKEDDFLCMVQSLIQP